MDRRNFFRRGLAAVGAVLLGKKVLEDEPADKAAIDTSETTGIFLDRSHRRMLATWEPATDTTRRHECVYFTGTTRHVVSYWK
jgi:hypothetical protein